MKNFRNTILKCLLVPVAACFIIACEKEHLQPDVPDGASAEPLVYMSAMLYSDSVYYAGGVDSYVGIVSMTDSMGLRYFDFNLYNELSTPIQPRPSCKISINNARFNLGAPEEDLDSTIFEGTLYYQDQSAFIPNAVTIEWYDSTGTMFSTALISQPPLNAFTITSVEDIIFENKTYKKVTAEFECILMEGNNFNVIPLTNGRATLLFGTN